jgi:1,2-dihydroxy-3-keto-5-methylthiopentene dioxygenase
MSRLTIYNDDLPDAPILRTEDPATIADELGTIGVRFERWESPVTLSPADDAETILAAYRPYLDTLMGTSGAGSADVIKLTPDHPQAAPLRAKFINEHSHTEDEVRFFVHGSGNFILHLDGRIYDAHCTAAGKRALMSSPVKCGTQPEVSVKIRKAVKKGCSPASNQCLMFAGTLIRSPAVQCAS